MDDVTVVPLSKTYGKQLTKLGGNKVLRGRLASPCLLLKSRALSRDPLGDRVKPSAEVRVRACCIQLFRQRLSNKSVKAYVTMPIGIMGRKSLALID